MLRPPLAMTGFLAANPLVLTPSSTDNVCSQALSSFASAPASTNCFAIEMKEALRTPVPSFDTAEL